MPRKKDRKQEPEAGRAPGEPRRITPVEIQQKEFGLAFRGYNERDVDQFLDEVTEEVARLYAENKRLREEVEFTRTSQLNLGSAEEAEALVRRAREEAARLLADARARASSIEGGVAAGQGAAPSGKAARSGQGAAPAMMSAAGLAPFVAQERQFLQNLANLIQAHAEAVKDHIRRARDAAHAASGEARRASREVESNEAVQKDIAARAESPQSRAVPGDLTPVTGEASPSAVHASVGDEIPEESGPPTQPWVPEELEPAGSQEWKGYYFSPSTSDASAEGEPPTQGQDEIVDLTAGPGSAGMEETTETDDVDRPYLELQRAARESEPPEDDSSEHRSIRELFWGED
jgi:cell division initiation protein